MNLKNQLVIGTGALFGLIAFNMTSANADEVTVKHGDTLSQIAQDHQTTVDAIKTANNLSSDLIVTGDVLTINNDNNSNTIQQTQDTYTVQAGDTLSEIAETYNIDINTLAQINNISDQNLIVVGDVLQLKQTQNTSPQDAQTASVSDNTNSANIHTQATQQSSTSQNTGSNSANTLANSSNTNNTQTNTSGYTSTNVSGSEADAKAWIAMRESGSNYNARNGQYIGKYQLTDIYLNGDYSPANQERTADQYVYGRYGSWVNAKNFWLSHGWY